MTIRREAGAAVIPQTAFGEVLTAELTPTLQLANPYELDPANRDDIETYTATGGTADNTSNLFRVQNGTSVGGYAVIRSKKSITYRAGEGMLGRVTAAFTTGIALSYQFAGLFSLTESAGFGYDGADFSIIYEYDGEAEIQTIQVTGTAADTVTVTLNGTAASGISITNSDVQTNAREIADALDADNAVNNDWRFEQIDDKVFCIAQTVGDKTGTMSISFAGSATGTLTETKAGVAKSSANVTQANWDNPTPFVGFDPTKINLYQIEFGYLGIANINFKIYNPDKEEFTRVHCIKFASTNTTPNFGNPDMKLGWASASLGSSGTNLIVTGGSMMGAIEGSEIIQESSRADDNAVASISTTLTAILSLENRIVYGDRFNLGKILPTSISVDNDHNKGIIVEIIKNTTLGGVPNFQYIDETNSVAIVDKAGTTITGGTILDEFTVGAGLAETIDLTPLNILLLPEDKITIAVKTVSGTATNTTATIVWREEK